MYDHVTSVGGFKDLKHKSTSCPPDPGHRAGHRIWPEMKLSCVSTATHTARGKKISQQKKACNKVSFQKFFFSSRSELCVSAEPEWTRFRRRRSLSGWQKLAKTQGLTSGEGLTLTSQMKWRQRKKKTKTQTYPFCYSSQQRASTLKVAPSANSSNSQSPNSPPSVRVLSKPRSGDLSGGPRNRLGIHQQQLLKRQLLYFLQ